MMANRPIFIPRMKDGVGVTVRRVDFQWFPGMSAAQKRRSIAALHGSAPDLTPILEISSKSEREFGVSLSAFNLRVPAGWVSEPSTVETVFQGSKVFERGGPYLELFGLDSRAAKRDPRIPAAGALLRFEFGGERWPSEPKTAFYDWIYIHSLAANERFAKEILEFRAFTDIEFNPERSINCQAAAAALFVSLNAHGELKRALSNRETFMQRAYGAPPVPT